MRKKQTENKSGLKSAFLFGFLVISIIIFSLVLKSYYTLKKSVYDGHHRFTIGIIRQTNPQVLTFYPDNKEISIYTFKGDFNAFKNAEIPMDSKIPFSMVFDPGKFSSELSSLLFNQKNNLIFWDRFRLYYFVKTVSGDLVKSSNISSKNASSQFFENEIQTEGLKIQIINATGESGFANRLSTLIANMGGNVVLLSTAKPADTSKIEYLDDSYTLRRLSKYLGYTTDKIVDRQVADIVIIIGKDSMDTDRF